MRAILRKTSTKQIAGYALLSVLTLLFMSSFLNTDRHGFAALLVSAVWAVISMIGFALLLQKAFTWAMGK